ncbi:MAG TPA: DNA polymerase III subunit epsilon [Candidatus Cybelea sp.]|nr:DNA polymerase III subunit epsilon [Candidatus Cybelea sp.]
MREVVLDTETTGLDPSSGHRIVEIGCIELVNQIATGRNYQTYVNPERDMPVGAFEVHGLSAEFLMEHPIFADVAEKFLEFIGEAPLVIHNAEFDMRFVNAELERLGRPAIPMSRTIDTVRMARTKFPGAQASLDALCRRFGIDNSARTKHGALLDAELLSEVYLELTGGRQPGLGLAQDQRDVAGAAARVARPARPYAPSAEELESHAAFVDTFIKDPIWRLP